MKIAFYMESSSDGGPDISLMNIIKYWGSKEDKIVLFCNKSHPGLPRIKRELKDRVTFVDLEFPIYIDLYLAIENKISMEWLEKYLKLSLHFIRFPLIFYQCFVLKKKFIDVMPDYLLINNGGYPGSGSCSSATVAASKLGIKTVMIIRGQPGKLYYSFGKIVEFIYDYFVDKHVDAYIAVSNAVKNSIKENRFLSINKINVIHNGISVSDEVVPVRLDEDVSNIGIVANFRQNKGHYVIFKSMELLLKKGINIKLYVVGGGTLKEERELKKWVSDRKLDDHIIFTGFKDNVYQFIAGLDLAVVPSIYYEACPVLIIEAMALNVPIVASNIGGVSELIENGKNGMLVTPCDPEGLADVIYRLINDNELRKRLVRNGKLDYSEKYTASRMSKQYYELLRKIY